MFDVETDIVDITITNSFVDNEDLRMILTACPNLESLTVEWAQKESAHSRCDWEMLGIALQGCPHLERLRLGDSAGQKQPCYEDLRESGAFDETVYTSQHPHHTLRDLPCLAHLEITENALFGKRAPGEDSVLDYDPDAPLVDVLPLSLGATLPPSLQKLTRHTGGEVHPSWAGRENGKVWRVHLKRWRRQTIRGGKSEISDVPLTFLPY